MNRIVITGAGAVSPAGWGVQALAGALAGGVALPTQDLSRRGSGDIFRARCVPPPEPRPAFLAQPRLRRASVITHYAMGAALEALGSRPQGRLGIVLATHAACVRYSERFYGEVCADPLTASPLLFPETVINAPASHLAMCLGGAPFTYTLVGDQTVFVEGLAVAAGWLATGLVDRALVVASEECDWFVSRSLRQAAQGLVGAEGAGALCLERESQSSGGILLDLISDSHSYAGDATRVRAARAMRDQMPPGESAEWLCDSRTGVARVDRAEAAAWSGWPGRRMSPRVVLGEGLAAATAWQFVAAWQLLSTGAAAAVTLSSVGFNAAAVGARLVRHAPPSTAG